MEIGSTNIKVMQAELKSQLLDLSSYLERIRQYHVGTKPTFMHRNHWNDINDGLHTANIKASRAYSLILAIERGQHEISGNQ